MAETQTKDLVFAVSEEWQNALKQNPWMSFVPEEAKGPNGETYQRKSGSSVTYKKVEDGYECVTCGSEIQSVEVVRPVWNGPFHLSGSGKTVKETVPYCPKCEQEPNKHGFPITIKFRLG
jgi:hypothetical protein